MSLIGVWFNENEVHHLIFEDGGYDDVWMRMNIGTLRMCDWCGKKIHNNQIYGIGASHQEGAGFEVCVSCCRNNHSHRIS